MKSAYLPHIDGLRAVAVLSVLIYHLNPAWLPGGFSGVDVFFVISGFVVSASVGSLNPKNLLGFAAYFYARRLQRIAPALIVCLVATTVAATLLIPEAWLSNAHERTGFHAFFGLSNFVLAEASNDYFSPTAEFNPYTHTWSLGVEEQFYFVFPILFFAWIAGTRWKSVAVGAFATIFAASFIYSAWLGEFDKPAAFYMITSRFWELAAGVLLFQLMSLRGHRFDTKEQASFRWHGAGAFFSLLLVAYGLLFSSPASFPVPGAMASVLGTLGLVASLHGKSPDDGLLMRALTNKLTIFVGKISYSLYLWHWPVIVLFRWTVGTETPVQQSMIVTIAIALAVASYYLVEKPVRYNPFLRNLPRYSAVAIGVLCVISSALIAQRITWRREAISWNEVVRHPDVWYPNATSPAPAGPGCTVDETRVPVGSGYAATYSRRNCAALPVTAPNVFSIGDSHAIAYSGLYKAYVMETGATVVVYNNGGCSFISLMPVPPRCLASPPVAMENLLERVQTGDVVFLPSLRLPRFSDQWIRFPDSTVESAIFSDEAVQARLKGVAEAKHLLEKFQAKGAFVVFEGPKPIFRSPAFRCAHSYNRTNPACRDGTEMNREELERLRNPALHALNAMADSIPRVKVWDPFPILCPTAPTCDAFSDNVPLFFDGDHLSGYGNLLLLPDFRSFMTNLTAERSSTDTLANAVLSDSKGTL